jgi:hypothetical protein
MTMKVQQLEQLVWIFIYGGMLSAALAQFVEEDWAPGLALGGGLSVLAGAAGIWWRSRMDDE